MQNYMGIIGKLVISLRLYCNAGDPPGFDPWVGKIPWRRKWQPAPVFLPGESHGPRSLVGYCPWDHKESDTTERRHFHFQQPERLTLVEPIERSWQNSLISSKLS